MSKDVVITPVTDDEGKALRTFKKDDVVRHFKNNLYKIHFISRHTETGEKMVVYESITLYDSLKAEESVVVDGNIWVRPYDMFASEVDRDKYPEVTQKYRFEIVNLVPVKP